MANNVTQYKLLISCPGDINEEIAIIDEVVDQFNRQFSETLNISISTEYWEKSSYPQSGGQPQELLNDQFVKKCDVVVAIFWTRFGTPTDKYGSGTEEEIEIMLEQGKQVFMYFCDRKKNPSEIDPEQYKKITEFRKKYESTQGISSGYKTSEEFRKKLNAHLTQYFLSLKQVESVQENFPKLCIKSIYKNKIINLAGIEKFKFNNSWKSIDDRIKEVKSLYGEIKASPIQDNESFGIELMQSFYDKIQISGNDTELIKKIAEYLGIAIDDSFFALGGLRRANFSTALPYEEEKLQGSEDEKEKYNKLQLLIKKILDINAWMSITECYDGRAAIKFLLVNEGQSFDEDIDIELTFPDHMFFSYTNLPLPPKGSFDNLIDKCTIEDIFEIPESAEYISYNESCKGIKSGHIVYESPFGKDTPYEEEYMDELEDVFDYKVYPAKDEASTIVKVHIDYIKQHSKVAFPAPIFINDRDICKEIHYKITSKQNPDIVEGIMTIKYDD